ncbi:MAG: hypothetical protein ACK41D_09350 [Rubricoccaceae bacterium]
MKKLLLLAAVAVSLSGCDFAGASEGAAFPAASIQITNLPASYADDDGGFDLVIDVRNAAGRAYFRAEQRVNSAEELARGVDVAVNAAQSIPFSTMPLFVGVYETDGDDTSARIMAVSQSFTVEQLAAAQAPLQLGTLRGSASFRIARDAR